MINPNDLQETDLTTEVKPFDELFQELGNNTYDYKDLISELIDNAIAARKKNQKLNVEINIYVDSDQEPVLFSISDNATGIPQEELGVSISPAGRQNTDSLNEHGLGMKQAIGSLGNLKYLATKTEEEEKARVVTEFQFGDIKTYLTDEFDKESGTEIVIENLKPIVKTNPQGVTTSIVPYLGARYRNFLKHDNRILELNLNIIGEDSGEELYSWNVEGIKPIYFHPGTRTNKPVIDNYKIKGDGWEAELTFGYAPKDEDEYKELGIEPVEYYHPYNVSLNKQGLDVLLHDRVILFHQLSELDIVNSRHNDFNTIRGEINLIKGFSTAITKNYIIHDQNFNACVNQIRKILRGKVEGPEGEKKDYLKIKTYPDEIPEDLIRDRLANWLKNNPMTKKEEVSIEYGLEGIEGNIDILADGEAWEIKTDKARAYDIYQLFMYMDIGEINEGFLLAKEFTQGAEQAKKHIEENHGKEVNLSTLDQFPVNHPPDKNERDQYY